MIKLILIFKFILFFFFKSIFYSLNNATNIIFRSAFYQSYIYANVKKIF